MKGCSGAYERKHVTHTPRHRGQLIVIDRVPAQIYAVCGDVLLDASTVRGIERLLQAKSAPDRTAPVYDYGHQLTG